MRNIQEKICTLILAVLAGGAIGIGGCVFLSLDDKVIGALIYTIGLYAICLHGLNLYTGKVGYLVNQPLPYCLDLVIIWVGNLAGTFLAAVGMQATRIASISEKAAEMCKIKLNDSLMSVFVLGIFCGFLMFVAVDGYRSTKNPVILFMGVAAFILCGFEHCIADMFYFSIAKMWSREAFLCILVITLGNSLGGIFIPLAKKLQ